MIISASRRTDIPAFYAEWMVDRLREGYCTVAEPIIETRSQDLRAEDVDAIVFWTRNSSPLMPYLEESDSRGYRYYFQDTILGYPREIDANDRRGNRYRRSVSFQNDWARSRVIWHATPSSLRGYAPGVPPRNFQRLAESLRGHACQVGGQHRGHVPEDGERLKELEGTPPRYILVTAGDLPRLDARLGGTCAGKRDGDR